MSYLVDTNLLLRWAVLRDPLHGVAVDAVNVLQGCGEEIFISPQNLVEFWSVATRPAYANGLGITPTEVDREVRRMEQFFPSSPISPRSTANGDSWSSPSPSRADRSTTPGSPP
jgi:hypothetical protein